MVENKHINVTLSYSNDKDISMDLRLPVNISVYSLIRELNQIFNKPPLQKKYQLKVVNKGIILGEEERLGEYPLADGDRIEILGNDVYEKC